SAHGSVSISFFFNVPENFFQAEDRIRHRTVTGVQTCALPISLNAAVNVTETGGGVQRPRVHADGVAAALAVHPQRRRAGGGDAEIGRAACRERVAGSGGGGMAASTSWKGRRIGTGGDPVMRTH